MFKWLSGQSKEHVEPDGDLRARKIPGGLEYRGFNMTTPFSFVLPGQNITSQGMVMTDTGRAVIEAEKKNNDEAVFDIDGRRISFSSHVIVGFDKAISSMSKAAGKAAIIGKAPVVELLDEFTAKFTYDLMAQRYSFDGGLEGEYWSANPDFSVFAIPGKSADPPPWYFWDMLRPEPATGQITNSVTHAITFARPRLIVLRAYLDRQVTEEALKDTRSYLKTCAASMKRGAEVSQS